MINIDLHIHTCFSIDGQFTPEEIIDLAIKEKVDVISITDHNSVRGIDRAIIYSKNKNITVIPGIEITCTFKGKNLHLLGYKFDYTKDYFNKLEEGILQQEKNNILKKIEKIRKDINLEINTQDVLKKCNNGVASAELIAELILENPNNSKSELLLPYRVGGERSDMPLVNFYWDYLSQGKPGYVPMEYITLSEAIKIIKDCGGFTVLAHPGNNFRGNEEIVDEIIKEGIDGIEVYSSYHMEEEIDFYLNKSNENNLIITYGTDFHGDIKPNISIGHFNRCIDKRSTQFLGEYMLN